MGVLKALNLVPQQVDLSGAVGPHLGDGGGVVYPPAPQEDGSEQLLGGEVGEILACFHLVYHEAAQYAAALPAGEAERYRTVLLTLWNLFAHVEQVECLVLTGELGEEEYPVLSRLAGEIQELLDPPRPALAELGLEGLPASGALCRAMERYRHNARLLLEAWEKQPVSC